MALILAGIDEAGYGPTLGPMCIGMTVWRLETWDQAGASPNLWKLLSPTITRKAPTGTKARQPSAPIAIADSKLLKRPNDSASIHPLTHLERGVLAALACTMPAAAPDAAAPPNPLATAHDTPSDDLALLAHLAGLNTHASPPRHRWCTSAEHWYDTDPTPLPLTCKADHLRIAANLLQRGLNAASIRILGMRCRIVPESEFNGIVTRTRNKGDVTLLAIAEHLRTIQRLAAAYPGDLIQIVCDRLGGREFYGPTIEQMLPGCQIHRADESATRSSYHLDAGGQRLGISFQVEAEQSHVPVALASMVAKLLRELAMARFNRYWGRRAIDLNGAELKPTAGYAMDARRWLTDAQPLLSEGERSALVRIL